MSGGNFPFDGVQLSDKEFKTLKQLKEMGSVSIPTFKKNVEYYQVRMEEFLQEEYVTFYLDTEKGSDTDNGLSRSKPMKTTAAVVNAARTKSGNLKLVIINSSSANVTFNPTEWQDSGNYLIPFNVIICESIVTSLLFTNNISLNRDYFVVDCFNKVSGNNGFSLNTPNGFYVRARNIDFRNSWSMSTGGVGYLEATENILIKETSGPISCLHFVAKAGNDVNIYRISGLGINCGTALIEATNNVIISPASIGNLDIKAKNITNIVPEGGSGSVFDRISTNCIWEATDTITLVSPTFNSVNDDTGIVYSILVKCHKLSTSSTVVRGNVYFDADIIEINENLLSASPINLSIVTKSLEIAENKGISIDSSSLVEGYDNVRIVMDESPTNGYIRVTGRVNAFIEMDTKDDNLEVNLYPEDAASNGSDRLLFERRALYNKEAVTVYLDPRNGSDSNGGLSRSNPKKTVLGAVNVVRGIVGSITNTYIYRLVILSSEDSISFEGSTLYNTVLFNGNDIRVPDEEDSKYLPFQVIISEDRATNIIFANSLTISSDGNLHIEARGNITFTNGMSTGCSNDSYIKAKNINVYNAVTLSGGGKVILDADGTLEIAYGGGISCGGGIVINAHTVQLFSGAGLATGGPVFINGKYLVSITQVNGSLSTHTTINSQGDIVIGQNTNLFSPSIPLLTINAAKNVTVYQSYLGPRTVIRAGGDVIVGKARNIFGVDIKARNFTDIYDPADPTKNGFDTGWGQAGADISIDVLENLTISDGRVTYPIEIYAIKLKAKNIILGTFKSGSATYIDAATLTLNTLFTPINPDGVDNPFFKIYINVNKLVVSPDATVQIVAPDEYPAGYATFNVIANTIEGSGTIEVMGKTHSIIETDYIASGTTINLNTENAAITGANRQLLLRTRSEYITYFLDTVNGNDNFNGLSRETPKRTLLNILNVASTNNSQRLRLVCLNGEVYYSYYDETKVWMPQPCPYPQNYMFDETIAENGNITLDGCTLSKQNYFMKSQNRCSVNNVTINDNLSIESGDNCVIFRPKGGSQNSNIQIDSYSYAQLCIGEGDNVRFGTINITSKTDSAAITVQYNEHEGPYDRLELECRELRINSASNRCYIDNLDILGALYVKSSVLDVNNIKVYGTWGDKKLFCELDANRIDVKNDFFIYGQAKDYLAVIKCSDLSMAVSYGRIIYESCTVKMEVLNTLSVRFINRLDNAHHFGYDCGLFIKAYKIEGLLGKLQYPNSIISMEDYDGTSGIFDFFIDCHILSNVFIKAMGERINSIVEVDEIWNSVVNLNPDPNGNTGLDMSRKFIERSKNITPYDAVIDNSMYDPLVLDFNSSNLSDLVDTISSNRVKSVFIKPSIIVDNTVDTGSTWLAVDYDKDIHGGQLEISGARKIRFSREAVLRLYSDLIVSGSALFEWGCIVYARKILGSGTITIDGDLYYEHMDSTINIVLANEHSHAIKTMWSTVAQNDLFVCTDSTTFAVLQSKKNEGKTLVYRYTMGARYIYATLSEYSTTNDEPTFKFGCVEPDGKVYTFTRRDNGGVATVTTYNIKIAAITPTVSIDPGTHICSVNVEPSNLSTIDIHEDNTVTGVEINLVNTDSMEVPIWWFKVIVGSDVTLSVKINGVAVSWIGTAIANIATGTTVEINVGSSTACGGVVV